jgi:putative PIG3 family NAD(P)H quinone oxidoreductase
MRAVVIDRPGGPDVLALREVEDPRPGRGEIVVRVAAAGVNRADLLQRAGGYPAPAGWPSAIPGLEYAGTVEKLGEGTTLWSVGARVMGLVGGGACAERVVVHEATAIPVPGNVSLAHAAAIPEAFLTAHDALFTLLSLRRGEALLVHAVGSGVGAAAVQLGAAAGARVLGTSRSEWKLERARALGLTTPIDASVENLVDAVLRATDGAGADAVLDLVGGSYFGASLRSLAHGGRVALIGLVAGARTEVELRTILARRLTIRGATMRARSLEERIDLARRFTAETVPLFERGVLQPVIDAVMPMEAVAEAHERVAANENFGKIVLTWG